MRGAGAHERYAKRDDCHMHCDDDMDTGGVSCHHDPHECLFPGETRHMVHLAVSRSLYNFLLLMWYLVFPVLLLWLFLVFIALVLWKRQLNHGTLPIATEDVAYDMDKYGSILSWDKHCLYIQGKPTLLYSGEFHYWRVPDRERWREILVKFKQCGLNAVRLYIHWGYHSPRENTFIFDGNRDLNYLLELCTALHLFVLWAPGPYICAETQGGGFPIWLLQKKEIRIRHTKALFYRVYDPQFSKYCAEWLHQVNRIIKRHQITENRNGCVLAYQIENESFETLKTLPLGLADDMRFLAKTVRDDGITVPLFTNDGFEEGSFIPQKSVFGIDMYGFDKYVIFVPTSDPLSHLMGGDKQRQVSPGTWKPWSTKEFCKQVDGMERRVRAFGGGAATSPVFIPELQGGWFNHYSVKHTYDHIYTFYGSEYTKTLVESCMAQGVTLLNLYMFYGGTNWGTIGDPDVYTSYDYSACIREYGKISQRARRVRQSFYFARSFEHIFSRTNPVEMSDIQSPVLHKQRVSFQDTRFLFFRNFADQGQKEFYVRMQSIELSLSLKSKESCIGIAHYTACNGIELLLSAAKVVARLFERDDRYGEVWILDGTTTRNEFAFFGDVTVHGTLSWQIAQDRYASHRVSKLSLSGYGYATIEQNGKAFHLLALDQKSLDTLTLFFCHPWFNKTSSIAGVYGVEEAYLHGSELHIASSKRDAFVSVITQKPLAEWNSTDIPFVFRKRIDSEVVLPDPILIEMSVRHSALSSLPWKALSIKQKHGRIEPLSDTLDLGMTSGHIFYKFEFIAPKEEMTFKINARHRATLYLNQVAIGGHLTYSLQIFQPGSKIGPDPGRWRGWKKYTLPRHLLRKGQRNELIVMVESFGFNRQPFLFNDVRNQRGILAATFSPKVACSAFVSGVCATDQPHTFGTTGFPDEHDIEYAPINLTQSTCNDILLPVTSAGMPVWYKVRVQLPSETPQCLTIHGKASCFVLLNDLFFAKYYGNGDSPQHHFLIPSMNNKEPLCLKFVCYDGREAMSKSDFRVSIHAYRIDEVTGNLQEQGSVYHLTHQQFSL